jgi:hypothetical protein
MKTNATIQQLNEALNYVNLSFAGNIRFKDIEQISKKTVRFTLTVKYSKEPGHRRGSYYKEGFEPKRLAAACWHVHGYFFEYLFLKYPDAIWIDAGGHKMASNSDNWQDKIIGSYGIERDLHFSEACDCHKDKIRMSYKNTDGWRGYSEPVNAIAGANNTGNWSDSPCPENVCLSELDKAKEILINKNIPYSFKWCETSNVFCVHGYILVKGSKRKNRAKELIKPLISETRLLYVC